MDTHVYAYIGTCTCTLHHFAHTFTHAYCHTCTHVTHAHMHTCTHAYCHTSTRMHMSHMHTCTHVTHAHHTCTHAHMHMSHMHTSTATPMVSVNETGEGANVTLTCTAVGNPLPIVTWQYNNITLPSSTTLTSSTPPPSTTVVLELHEERVGEEYTCVAINSHAGESSVVSESIIIRPSKWLCRTTKWNKQCVDG